MSREVLNPPPVVLVPPDPSEAARRRNADKFGNASRAREVAVEKVDGAAAGRGDRAADPAPAARGAPGGQRTPGASEGPAKKQAPARPPAFAAAYFNKDVAATDRPSPRAQAQRALRGSDDITDLKKIVLPAGATDTVSPEALRQVGELMGVAQATEAPDLRDLLARLGSWAQAPSMTVERLQARLAQLEDMVAARRAALTRMSGAQRADHPALSPEAPDPAADPEDAVGQLAHSGNQRVQRASQEAAGMHQRLARTLGIKRS